MVFRTLGRAVLLVICMTHGAKRQTLASLHSRSVWTSETSDFEISDTGKQSCNCQLLRCKGDRKALSEKRGKNLVLSAEDRKTMVRAQKSTVKLQARLRREFDASEKGEIEPGKARWHCDLCCRMRYSTSRLIELHASTTSLSESKASSEEDDVAHSVCAEVCDSCIRRGMKRIAACQCPNFRCACLKFMPRFGSNCADPFAEPLIDRTQGSRPDLKIQLGDKRFATPQ